ASVSTPPLHAPLLPPTPSPHQTSLFDLPCVNPAQIFLSIHYLPSSSLSVRPPPLLHHPLPSSLRSRNPETEDELAKDPTWAPLPPVIQGLPKTDYIVISTTSLVSILIDCPRCAKGKNDLNFHTEGMAISATGKCNLCPRKFTWNNSSVLKTSREASTEKLKKINVDIVNGAVLTAIGATKLRLVFLLSGLPTLSHSTFHRIKKNYTGPAISEHFFTAQTAVIEAVKGKIAKGEKLHVSGDGSFDSRGYSAAWCRYFILDAQTGEALHYILMHKTDTGSSSTMEVAAFNQGLMELSLMIGGSEHIASVVTDRHAAVTKMMREKYPGIGHYFDPGHFFRNITLTLISITKPQYMKKVRGWVKVIINRCYDAVITAQGNGEIASEKFRAILLCMTGQHTFDK
ncbi:hypothetical protein PFISCL1PPCAC_22448, partial [Pristionchus fissidentatus]